MLQPYTTIPNISYFKEPFFCYFKFNVQNFSSFSNAFFLELSVLSILISAILTFVIKLRFLLFRNHFRTPQ